jgi:hypothetical protein
MKRRHFIGTVSTGITGIIASQTPPAFARDTNMQKIGHLGIGGHYFSTTFTNPPESFDQPVKCMPYGVWDDVPEAAESMLSLGFEKVYSDPVELVNESDVVYIDHADYRKSLELAQPALEQGKPVYIDRPFAGSIADAEEMVRLAEENDAPLMSASSLEFQPEVADMRKFAEEHGPVRAYESYCPELVFTWMFPHTINYAHAGLGGGIDSAYFSGDYVIDPAEWVHIEHALSGSLNLTDFPDDYEPDYSKREASRPVGGACGVLQYKPRAGQPSILGMVHIGEAPASYHVHVYAMDEDRRFQAGDDLFDYMFFTLHDFFVNRKVPRPYDALLEQHRTLVALNKSRLSGTAVKLDSLTPEDSLPYSDKIREVLVNWRLGKPLR